MIKTDLSQSSCNGSWSVQEQVLPMSFLSKIYLVCFLPHMDGTERLHQKSRTPWLHFKTTGLSSYNSDSCAKNSRLSKKPCSVVNKNVNWEKKLPLTCILIPEFQISLCLPTLSLHLSSSLSLKEKWSSKGHKLTSSKCMRQLLLQFMCVSQSWTAEKTKNFNKISLNLLSIILG